MGWTDIDDYAADDLAPRQRQAFLERRIRELTDQLDQLNKLFPSDSEGDTENPK
jgi:hypothetical protein